jgi:protein-L-isoaspartate O-methyltransferase
MTESSEVREFYDEFSGRVLIRDFRYVNLRHEVVKSLCQRFIAPGSAVLEVGCGAGIITKSLGRTASRVLAIDISPKNIELAREFASSSNTRFEVVDIVERGRDLGKHGPFDVILAAAVIEHIPKANYGGLFSTLEGLLSGSGRVILTFPSPEIQEYMRTEQPDDVQVIDESIELTDLLSVTSLKPLYFAYCDIFGKNDYVHVVLSAERPCSARAGGMSPLQWVVSRLRKYRWRFGNLGFLRRVKRKGIVD